MQWKTFGVGAIAGAILIVGLAAGVAAVFPNFTAGAFGAVEDDAAEAQRVRKRIETTTGILRDQIERYERALAKARTEADRGRRITSELAAELRAARESAQLIGQGIAGLQDDNASATEPIRGVEEVARQLGEIAETLEAQNVD